MLWFSNLPIKQRRRLFPSALPKGRLCGLGKGEEVKTERKKLFIRISKNHSGDYWIEKIKK